MNQINPATYNFVAYREDTFAFALLIENTEGDPIDVNDTFDSLSMRVFLPNREENPALEPELSVSGNQITGVLSSQDTKKLSGRAYWYEVRVTFNGNEETLLNGRFQVRNAQDGKGAQAADLNVTVDFTTLEVTVQTADSAALALQAVADANDARDEAQTARDEAVTAKDNSETARDEAVTAKNDAETARDDAIDAKNDAETAKDEIQALAQQIEDNKFISQQAWDTAALLKLTQIEE